MVKIKEGTIIKILKTSTWLVGVTTVLLLLFALSNKLTHQEGSTVGELHSGGTDKSFIFINTTDPSSINDVKLMTFNNETKELRIESVVVMINELPD